MIEKEKEGSNGGINQSSKNLRILSKGTLMTSLHSLKVNERMIKRTLNVGGSITVQLVSRFKRLDLTKQENMLFFVCNEAAESKLVKLETSCSVILSQQ